MKKLTGFIAAVGIALAPMSASALEALTDNAMSDVTAQAGVHIAIDDVILFQTIDYTKYTDTDGMDENKYTYHQAGDTNTDNVADDAASLVISKKETLKVINAIWKANEVGTGYGIPGQTGSSGAAFGGAAIDLQLAADGWVGSKTFTGHAFLADGYRNKDVDGDGVFDIFSPSALMIDIGNCKVLSAAAAAKSAVVTGVNADSTITGVCITLPTVEIKTSADSYFVGIVEGGADGNTKRGTTINSGKNFIKIEKGNSLMAVLGGDLEIAPH
jgi:hypothetical protein